MNGTSNTMAVVTGAAAMIAVVLPSMAESQEFEEAKIFFELNNTDGDLGIHGKVDGGPWTRVVIEKPGSRPIMRVQASGPLWWQEVTELFFESAEPPFDELEPAEFFNRFPEGSYTVRGWSLNAGDLESEADVTHTMPAPAQPTVNGMPMAQQCDEEEEGFDITEIDSTPVTIAWEPVTMSHPDLGTQPPVEVEIVNYEAVVEAELEIDGEEFVSIYSVILPPDITSVSVPEEFLQQTDRYKYEILAREATDNQTAVESCFLLAE